MGRYMLCGQFYSSQDRAVVIWNQRGCVETPLKSGTQLEEIPLLKYKN